MSHPSANLLLSYLGLSRFTPPEAAGRQLVRQQFVAACLSPAHHCHNFHPVKVSAGWYSPSLGLWHRPCNLLCRAA
jgi:hypothetical protein